MSKFGQEHQVTNCPVEPGRSRPARLVGQRWGILCSVTASRVKPPVTPGQERPLIACVHKSQVRRSFLPVNRCVKKRFRGKLRQIRWLNGVMRS